MRVAGVTTALALIGGAAGAGGVAAAAGKTRLQMPPSTLPAGGTLPAGQSLVSLGGQFTLTMTPAGALVETSGRTQLGSWGPDVAGSSAVLGGDGQLQIVSAAGAVLWSSPAPATAVPTGTSPVLTVSPTGPLVVTAGTATLWVSGPNDSTLVAGQRLQPGWSLTTADYQYTLTMQPSGALVLTSAGTPLWSDGKAVAGSFAVMQADGNLVEYSPAGHALWASNTGGHPDLTLSLATNGQVILQNPNGVHLWGQPAAHWGLAPGQKLEPGWSVQSPNGLFELAMAANGRLTEYLAQPDTTETIWSTKAAPAAGSTATMQADGNFVITSPKGKAVWSSGTSGKPGTTLQVTNDAAVLLRDAGTTLWNSNSVTVGTVIVADAASQVGNADRPAGGFCNPYTAFWGAGSSCSNGNRSEAWCADFAAWVWQRAGVPFTYGWTSSDINAAAASFYRWASARGAWHWASSGYVPRPGDVAVFGLSSGGAYADHAAIVLEAGAKGADVVNGDWWSTGNGSVVLQDSETTATGSDSLSGYASPVLASHINANIVAAKLSAAPAPPGAAAANVRSDAGRMSATPAGVAAVLARQAAADRESARVG